MILITGATGFIGNALLTRAALNPSLRLRGTIRGHSRCLAVNVESVVIDDLSANTNWAQAVNRVDTVVHLAARVHVMHDTAADPLAEFRRVNVAGTLNLGQQAADAGAQRFIFISSIKVNGEQTAPGKSYSAEDTPDPVDPYGISKHEAEQGLLQLSRKTGMEVVIIRPVLVYGPGVKANFLSMMHWLHKGIPLPLGAIHDNRRSLVALDNLVDLIMTCLYHPAAASQVFLVSDGEDLSTTELLQRTGVALGKPARLIPVPVSILQRTAGLFGKADLAQRLCGSIQVDINKTRKLLGWTPPVSLDNALNKTTQHFLSTIENH